MHERLRRFARAGCHCLTLTLLGSAWSCSSKDSSLFGHSAGTSGSARGGAASGGFANGGAATASGGVPGTLGGAPGVTGGAAGAATSAGTSSGGSAGSSGAGGDEPPTLIGAVTFSEPSRTFKGELAVAMTTSVGAAEIRYTTDRTLPTAASTLYSGDALTLTATTVLRAQPFSAGAPAGAVSTAYYVARDFDASSELPLVVLDGFGQGEPNDKDVWVDAVLMTFEPVKGEATLAALPTLAARAGHHIHGQSSANFPQKSYRLELRDNADQDSHYEVLGMPAESDWVLVAPYYDRALIRNTFMYGLGRDMGLQAPRVAYAEVYVNHQKRALAASDYAGVYYVTETIKNSKVRTNLKQLDAMDTVLPAVSGGYIMKFDWGVSEPPTLPCVGAPPISNRGTGTCWTDLEVVDPDPLGAEQQTFIADYVQRFHDSLHTSPLGDYASAIDLPSFIDYFLINELSRSLDEFTRSAYFFKDRDGQLSAGPLWDYNFALDCGRPTSMATEGWQYGLRPGGNDWFVKLAADPVFTAAAGERWRALRQTLLSEAAVDARISALIEPLAAAAARDLERWPVAQVFSSSQQYSGPMAPTWEGQVQAIRDWIPQRMAWMDTQFP